MTSGCTMTEIRLNSAWPRSFCMKFASALLEAAGSRVGDEHRDAERHLAGLRADELHRFVPDFHRKVSRPEDR